MSVGYRFLLASAVLFAFCRWRKMPLNFTRAQHADLFFFGAGLFSVSYILVYYAETFVVSGMVAIGYSASPMIAMFFSRVFFGTPMTARVAAGAVLGITGIVSVFWHEFGNLSVSRNAELGAIVTMLSVLASGAGNMVAMRTQKRGLPTWASMAWGMLYGGALSLAIGVATGKSFAIETSAGYWLSLVYLAIFGSIITFACFLTLMKRIGAAPASYVGVMVPIIALTISFFFEKFAWGWLTTIGIVLSVLGNVAMLGGKNAGENQKPE
jgi:drug/metabolite transporter (DMT)-like permease